MIILTTYYLTGLISLCFLVHIVYSVVIPEHDLPKEPHDDNIPSQVSWYSIFWALFALAVNSMSQPSLLDKHISPSSLLFLGQSSPIVCVTDAGDVILDLFVRLVSGETIREASRGILWRRARDRIDPSIEGVEETTLEKFPIATAVIFIGPLSQAIKLYGYEGILWAKVIATMYLSSYLVLTLLVYLAPQSWRHNPPISTSSHTDLQLSTILGLNDVYTEICNKCGVTLIALQLLLYIWFISAAIEGLRGESMSPPETIFECLYTLILIIPASMFLGLRGCLVLVVQFSTVIIAGSFTFRGILASTFKKRLCYFGSFVLVVPALVAFCYFCSYPQILPVLHLTDESYSYSGMNYLGAFVMGICVVLLAVEMVVQKRGLICRRVPFLRQWFDRDSTVWLVAFVMFNISVMLLYLVKGYDSTGTVKPAWTDYLG